MQSNWTALQTKMKGKGGRHRDRRNASIPKRAGPERDARVTKKRKTKHARRRANDDDATRGRSSEETPETAAASRRTHAKPSHETRSRADPVRFDGGDAAPRASAPPRPSDDARGVDDTAPLAPERRRARRRGGVGVARAVGDGPFSGPPRGAGRGGAPRRRCRTCASRSSEPLQTCWARTAGRTRSRDHARSDGARADPRVPTDDAARAFCARVRSRRSPRTSARRNFERGTTRRDRACDSVRRRGGAPRA